jgi:hypothetical protein
MRVLLDTLVVIDLARSPEVLRAEILERLGSDAARVADLPDHHNDRSFAAYDVEVIAAR